MDIKKYNNFPIIRADVLQQEKFKKLEWLIPDIIPFEGLTIVAAPPKSGKSTLIHNFALEFTAHEPIWNKLESQVKTGGILYISFEVSKRALQNNQNAMVGNKNSIPSNLYYSTTWERVDEGGIDKLEYFLQTSEEIVCVIIDTWGHFQRIRNISSQYSYQKDIKEIEELKLIGRRHNIAIILIHHTIKPTQTIGIDNWVDLIQGTRGIAGTADTLIYFNRKIYETTGSLYVVGKDVQPEEYVISFDKKTMQNTLVGTKRESKIISLQRIDIMKKLTIYSEHGLTPTELAKKLGKNVTVIKPLLQKMLVTSQVYRDNNHKYFTTKEM